MKLLSLQIKNFQSYADLNLNLDNKGLTLISGQTGSGKSGILDAIFWTLYGLTGKDGNSDDIRSWQSAAPTEGVLTVDTPKGSIRITRIRTNGKNDLFFTPEGTCEQVRGKDLNDTQKKITEILGVSAEEFLISSYLHQFSKSDTFFIAKAKDRREIIESIVDLSLAIKLGDKASESRKKTKADLHDAEIENAKNVTRLQELEKSLTSTVKSSQDWESRQAASAAELEFKRANFDKEIADKIDKLVAQLEELDRITVPKSDFDKKALQIRSQLESVEVLKKERAALRETSATSKADFKSLTAEAERLEALPDTCPECLGPSHNANSDQRLAELRDAASICQGVFNTCQGRLQELTSVIDETNEKLVSALDKCKSDKANNDRLIDKFERTQADVVATKNAVNHYQEQLVKLKAETNPFSAIISSNETAAEAAREASVESLGKIEHLQHRLISLNWLYDKSYELRGALMGSAIDQLNENVNTYLERHFDAAIRIKLTLPDSDKIEVEVFNNGYSCPYKQLSGGERRMLALAFNIAVMKAAQNKIGIHFNCLMLDEAFAGLDNTLKCKAFSLLQSLEAEHETILVIEHDSEFKALFDNKMEVTKNGDYSEVVSA